MHPIECELVAMDGTGHTSDYAGHYYAKIRGKCKKSYIKNHITIDADTRMILNYAANQDPKYNKQFAIASIRQLKLYKPHYIPADIAYDTEPIKKCINKEVGAFDQIPLKHEQHILQTKQFNNLLVRCLYMKNECGKHLYVIKIRFKRGNYSRSTTSK